MKIVFLDSSTVGDVKNLNRLRDFGELISYEMTAPHERHEMTADADIIISNKVVIDAGQAWGIARLDPEIQ